MPTVAKSLPATTREVDGEPVPFADALAAWTVAAREALQRTARNYNGYLTYAELAEIVQEQSGIRTPSQVRHWIGRVLEATADECHRRGDPPLTSLCVDRDESVGSGYEHVLALKGVALPADLDHQAATDRLACYVLFAQNIPAHGGYAALTPKVAATRRRAARLNPAPGRLCPSCNTVLPSSGQCDNCG
jgi:hypothetical protein